MPYTVLGITLCLCSSSVLNTCLLLHAARMLGALKLFTIALVLQHRSQGPDQGYFTSTWSLT